MSADLTVPRGGAAQATPFQGFTIESMGNMGNGETVLEGTNVDEAREILTAAQR